MSSKTKTTTTKEEARHALVPKLRFPEFRGAKGWESGKVDDHVDTVTPPKKLPTASYASSGAFPIIDQSQSDICGWTDDNEALIREGLPLIVFGDHTCILKLISRPFAQGADGIKILKSRSQVGTPFLFQFLSYRPVVTEEYKRHYSILKEKAVFYPELKSGEQQKIAECLSSVDELMAAQARKVGALKIHKNGLMQQLFPGDGETKPKLRFPEFQNAGKWSEMRLGDIGRVIRGASPRPKGDPRYYGGPVPRLMVQDVTRDGKWVTPRIDSLTTAGAKLSRPCKAGTLTIVCSGTVGVVSFLAVDACIHDGFLALIEIDESKATKDFLYHSLSTLRLQFEEGATHGGVFTNLTTSGIQQFEIKCPKPPEQQRIAACLSGIDDLITSETQKLEALKAHKRALMQQMFPTPHD